MGYRCRYELHAAVPTARNGVDWGKVYGGWKAAGYETDVCIMFNDRPAKAWKNLSHDARNLWPDVRQGFRSIVGTKLVASAEVGNEPGNYDDKSYRTLSRAWPRACAKAIRS